ncbi:MAG: hypothetical protein WDW38_003131 [Sanguina aurantia]
MHRTWYLITSVRQVSRLLRHGADVNFQDEGSGRTALAQACQSGCADIVRSLLDGGADCYLHDNHAVSPLMLACQAGYQEIVEVLLVRGEADAYHCSDSGRTSLLEAASEGHTNCMAALMELGGADVNYVSEPGKEHALLLAAAGGHLAALKLLLQHGAKVNRTDACGTTALHAAARHGDVRMVQVLLQHRAKCIAEFKSKHTPLHEAAAAGHTAVLKLLLESNVADASVLDSGLKTAAQLAHHASAKVIFEQYAEIARGGNGVVSLVIERETGKERACKRLPKQPKEDASDAKRMGYVESLRREVAVLTMLKGSLQVAQLVEVFETDSEVQIVMELCRGGELHQRIGSTHYSERTAASYMRSVLRTLAQCHSHHILHRDVKLGNFLLVDDSARSPLRAVDFGLAVPFDPESLPMKNLPLEGTPWRSVLLDEVDYSAPCWDGVSREAISFVKSLLQRDPLARPSAKEALKHPFLAGTSRERSSGKQLFSVVARLQRFSQGSTFKRSVLQSIAAELLLNPQPLDSPTADTDEATLLASQQPTGPHSQPATATATADSPEAMDLEMSGQRDVQVPSTQSAASAGGSSGGEARSACLPSSLALQQLCRQLHLDAGSSVDAPQLAESLTAMGYDLDAAEVERLLTEVSGSSTGGRLGHVEFAASQIDYRYLQEDHADRWLALARTAFTNLDVDQDGLLGVDEIIAALRTKLPPGEIRAAVELAMQEAGHGPASAGLAFEDFMRMLKVRSTDSLGLYDNRSQNGSSHRGRPAESAERLNQILQGGFEHSRHSDGKASENGSQGGSHKRRMEAAHASSHDASQSRQGQYHGPVITSHAAQTRPGAAANSAAAPAPIVWRFDVHTRAAPAAASQPPPRRPTAPAVTPAQPQARQPVPSVRASPGSNVSASAGMERAWNFDPVPKPASQRVPKLASVEDFGGAVRAGPVTMELFSRPAVVLADGRGGERTGRCGAVGGYFDKRHHGDGLYKSMLAAAAPAALPTVRE